jgi:DNA repair exonuclease SbcCD ATPase subunit
MARGNGRTINVKIPTVKVINALQQALAKLELDYTSQDQAEAKYQEAAEKWRKDIQKWAIDNFSKAENIRTNYRSWSNTLNVDFDIMTQEGNFPAEPERNFETMNVHSYRDMKEEIANAIRILQLTDEEVVSTSTYNSIARYL